MPLNFIKGLDCFSPDITLFIQGRTKHSSVFSGLLSAFQNIIFLATTIYYFKQVVIHQNPTFYYVKKYIDNPADFDLTPDNFNHTVTLRGNFVFDPKAITVVGVKVRPNRIISGFQETDFDLWYYGPCENEENKNKLCIESFYDHQKKQLFSKNDQDFYFPSVGHETLSDDSIPYNILIKNCENSPINNNFCHNDEIIKEAQDKILSADIDFFDKYVNVENYEDPFVSHFNSFEVGTFENSIASANVHFNPTIVKTKEGLVVDTVKIQKEYTLDQIIHGSYKFEGHSIIGIVSLWVHNQVNSYERSYPGLASTIAKINAITKLTWTGLFLINFFFHRYVLVNDFSCSFEKMSHKLSRTNVSISSSKDSSTKSTFWYQSNEKNGCKKSQGQSMFVLKKAHHTSLFSIIFDYYRCKKNDYIKNLMKMRFQALSEEKMIQYFLMFSKTDVHEMTQITHLKSSSKATLHSINDSEGKKSEYFSKCDPVKTQNFVNNLFSDKRDD